ncbi:MAG: CARDB domain-containing protein, partial [Candidatus Thorarchaeota archaeon]
PTLDTSGTTDTTGNATFTLLGSEWNGTEETFYGSYSVTGVYGTNTSDATEGVVLDTNRDVTLVFSSVKPDPYIYSLNASTTTPVSGETVTIYATINNTGPTETTVDILFFVDGNETTGDLIHEKSGVHLGAGESRTLSFQWPTIGYPDGAHYVYAILTAPADADTTNNNATLAMTIQPARPDLRIIDMAFYYNGNPVNSGVVGAMIEVNVTLNNSGTADAIGTVYVTLVDETTGTTIGTKTVPSFLANTDRYVLFDWTLQLPAGQHDLNVTVDPTNMITELNETNNYMTSPFTVLGKANLTVERIWFSETAPFENNIVTIYAEIANLGEEWANGTIHYAFWDGEVNVGTVITDRNTAINLGIGASIVITTQWNATGSGEHTISFSVDTQDISESTTSDNQLSTRIIVYRGDNLDLVIDDNTVVNITSSYYQQGYILIKDNGTLNVVGATLYMRESAPDQYNIIVRDNGTIRFLSGGTLTSNYAITMWLEGNATLVAEGGFFSSQVSVKTTTQDGSTASNIRIQMVDFTLNGVFESESGINVSFTATNTSFYYPIYRFGGSSYGVFTNCRVPYFSLQENAHVTVKAWVRVYVYDANNRPISGAVVEPREYLDPQSVVDGISLSTGVDGSVLMALRTDELYAPPSGSGGVISTFVGNYYINVTFTDVRGDTHYAMAPIDPPLPAYPDSLSQPIPTVRDIEFVLSNVKPDLDPPVSVDDTSLPRFNSTTVRTNITNMGISTAYNVLVRFTDLATGEVFNETLVDEIGVGETVWINVTRTFTEAVFGTHTLEVYVNPPDNNPYYLEEENETNNIGTADVSVFPLSDLVPSTIEFSIDEPAEGDYISIEAILVNDGDVAATFNISCYLDEVGNESHLLGFVEDKYLGAGQSTAPTKVGEWYIPSEGIAGAHTIYVVVDVNGTVWEYDETNNVLSRNLTVYRRADLSINPGSIDVSHREAEDGQVVNITARVENTGEKPASNVVVWFFVDRNENMQYDSQTDEFIQEVVIDTIQPAGSGSGSVGKASATWVASTTEPNVTFQIGVLVNPYHNTPPDEYNWTDNQAFTQITVTLLRDLSISFQDVTFLVIDTYNVEMDVMVHVEGQAAENIYVLFYEDANSNGQMDSGEVFGEKTISGPVEPGAVVPVSATLNVTQNRVMARYHTVYVAVNPDGAIHEINTANNIIQYPLPDPRPDLQVSDVRFYETPVDGMETTLNFTLINNGLSDSRNVWIAVYDGNITNGTLIWDSGTHEKTWNLSAGTSLEANVTLTLYGAGIHNITVVVNPQMEGHNITIPEFNEDNNVAFNDTVNVTLPPFVVHLYTPGSGAQFTVGGKPIPVTGYIDPPPTDTARANITVFLYRSSGETYYESPPVHPNADGSFYVEVPAPADTDNNYMDVTLTYENATYSLNPNARPVITLVPPVKKTGLPLWAIIA